MPAEMMMGLTKAILAAANILMHWSDEHSFDKIVVQLSSFDSQSWEQRLNTDTFAVPDLIGSFRDRLREFGQDGLSE